MGLSLGYAAHLEVQGLYIGVVTAQMLQSLFYAFVVSRIDWQGERTRSQRLRDTS